jgi:WD40 repeat protein
MANLPEEGTGPIPSLPGQPNQAAPGSPAESPEINTLGKYRMQRKLGQGGMGVVYQAEDTLLDRQVAVKVLPAAQSAAAAALSRFRREASAVARLNHPNVVPIYEIDQEQGTWYIVMELLEGGSAQDRLKAGGPFAWQEATRIAAGACRGLAAAHAAGLIHRDLKPSNILLARDGTAKLGDFGLVYSTAATLPQLTSAGQILGTPSFMSPEQGRGESFDERSDVYSLGATYYALLTGVPPFSADNPVGIVFAHCASPIPNPCERNPEVPVGCAGIIRRALAKRPVDRYQTAAELLAALEGLIDPVLTQVAPPAVAAGRGNMRIGGRRRWLALAAGVVLLGLLLLAVFPLLKRGGRAAVSDGDDVTTKKSDDVPRKLAWQGEELDLREPWPVAPAQPPWPEGKPRPKPVDPLPPPLPVDGEVEALAFAPERQVLAVASRAGVRVWDWTNRKQLHLWPEEAIRSVAFSVNGQVLAAAAPGAVRLFSFDRQEWQLAVEGAVLAVAFSPDGKMLAAGIALPKTKRVAVKVWDFPSCALRHTIDALAGQSCALAFTENERMLAAGGEDGIVSFWDQLTGKPWLDRLTGKALAERVKVASRIHSLAFSPRARPGLFPPGDWLAISHNEGVEFWDTHRWVMRYPHWIGPMTAVAFSPNGHYWAYARDTGQVFVRNNQRKADVQKPLDPIPRPGQGRVAFAPDNKTLATVDGRSVRLWDLSKW